MECVLVCCLQFKGYTAECHVGNGCLITGEMKSSTLEICLALLQRERQQSYGVRQTAMQSAVVADDVIKHPTGCRAADYKHHISLAVCP